MIDGIYQCHRIFPNISLEESGQGLKGQNVLGNPDLGWKGALPPDTTGEDRPVDEAW